MLNALARMAIDHWIFLLVIAIAVIFRRSLRFEQPQSKLLTIFERDRVALTLVIAISLLVSITSGWLHGMPLPHYHDDYGYLLDADTFVHGRLSNPPHPLWRHFETIHVLVLPRYISKYEVGQGLMFAAGTKFLGHPARGGWIVAAMACAAVWWALRVWTTPSLALLGGIATAIHPTMLNWTESYHNGQLAALAGALTLAAAGRLRTKPSWQMSVVLGVGVVILANNRPFEGLVLCVGIGMLLLRQPIVRVAPAGLVVVAAGLGFIAFHNHVITGNAFLLPFSLYEQRYDPVPTFIWQKARPIPHYGNAELAHVYEDQYLAHYREVHARGGLVKATLEKIRVIDNALFGPTNLPNPRPLFLLLLIAAVPLLREDHNSRLPALVLLLFAFAPLSIGGWMPSHFVGPAVAAGVCLMMLLVRRLFVASPLLATAVLVLFFANSGLMWFWVQTHDVGFETKRRAIAESLLARGGHHLIIVAPDVFDAVYNVADLNGAPIVWAHDLGGAPNARLIAYYRDRGIWYLSRTGLRRY